MRYALPLAHELCGNGHVLQGIRHPRCRKIDDTLAQDCANSTFVYSTGHLFFKKISVAAGCGTRQQKLGTGQQGCGPNRIGIDKFTLGRENIIIQPLLQGQIIGQASEKRHGQVGVGIHQTGQDQPAIGIDVLSGHEQLTVP